MCPSELKPQTLVQIGWALLVVLAPVKCTKHHCRVLGRYLISLQNPFALQEVLSHVAWQCSKLLSDVLDLQADVLGRALLLPLHMLTVAEHAARTEVASLLAHEVEARPALTPFMKVGQVPKIRQNCVNSCTW
eukprot:CAMPEP_0171075144 /NCGR_PEP_ID=MMETSP0766_2-20121228/12596_1 /TAXON_ID=439317 /ORGANISM="Gambierdiscus australes, Strain CAWD 149" /LENGTH=132 /DNA_ID=CAMNT_0011531987 /DNA_START=91 /DNA_END=489 /DNA_ORIENTATION=-